MPTKDFSSKQESMVAEYLGWSVVAGSGAAACFPGDVIGDDWLCECKTHVTADKKIFFSKSVWKKICKEALVKHRYPLLVTDDGSQRIPNTWCVFRLSSLNLVKKQIIPITDKYKTNISFDHEKMAKAYVHSDTEMHDDDLLCVLSIDWGDEKVGLCPICTFRSLLNM